MAKRDNIRRALARARVARRQWVDVPGVPNARADRAGLDVADDLLPKPGAHYREQAARGILDRFGGGRA